MQSVLVETSFEKVSYHFFQELKDYITHFFSSKVYNSFNAGQQETITKPPQKLLLSDSKRHKQLPEALKNLIESPSLPKLALGVPTLSKSTQTAGEGFEASETRFRLDGRDPIEFELTDHHERARIVSDRQKIERLVQEQEGGFNLTRLSLDCIQNFGLEKSGFRLSQNSDFNLFTGFNAENFVVSVKYEDALLFRNGEAVQLRNSISEGSHPKTASKTPKNLINLFSIFFRFLLIF